MERPRGGGGWLMTILDTAGSILSSVGGIFGGLEGSDAASDALNNALRSSNALSETITSNLAPFLNTGTNANNALNQVFFGTPQSFGNAAQRNPGLDLGAVSNALAAFEPSNRQERRRLNNALGRVEGLEGRLNIDTSGFTNRQNRKFDAGLNNRIGNLEQNLTNLGLNPDDFRFVVGETGDSALAQPASLDPFFESPEFQLFGAQNSRAVDDTFNALAGRGLLDSGIGREAVTDTVTRNLGNSFNAFVNRNAGLAGSGQNAAVQGGSLASGILGQTNALNTQLGGVNAGRQIGFFNGLGDIGNSVFTQLSDNFS